MPHAGEPGRYTSPLALTGSRRLADACDRAAILVARNSGFAKGSMDTDGRECCCSHVAISYLTAEAPIKWCTPVVLDEGAYWSYPALNQMEWTGLLRSQGFESNQSRSAGPQGAKHRGQIMILCMGLFSKKLNGPPLTGQHIKDLKPPQPPDFNNRLNANWKLLFQIAQHAGGGWPEQACRSAIYLSRAPYEPSVGVQLLAALRAMFTNNRTEITSEQVVQELVADPNSPWHEYRGRGPITKNQVAALLRDYDIRPVVVHPTKRADCSRHGYRAAQFEDAFARFLPHEPNIRTLKSGREKM